MFQCSTPGSLEYAANDVLGSPRRPQQRRAERGKRFPASQVIVAGPIVAARQISTVPILQQPTRENRVRQRLPGSREWAIQDSNPGPLPYQGRSEATSSRLQSSKMLQTARFSGMRGDLRRLQLTI